MEFPEYVKPPELFVITSEPDTVLLVNTTPPVLLETVAFPLSVLPVIATPPELLEMLSEPVRWLLSKDTPPVLLVNVTLPVSVSPVQDVPPIRTGPLEPVTETDPVMLAPQSVIPTAPVELSDPVIVPPLTQRPPPAATVMDPVIFPPDAIQITCPFATVSGPLTVVVVQAWLKT